MHSEVCVLCNIYIKIYIFCIIVISDLYFLREKKKIATNEPKKENNERKGISAGVTENSGKLNYLNTKSYE